MGWQHHTAESQSHTGCLLNERADELAELGSTAEGPEICPGPQKYGSFWLRVRPETRLLAEECGKPLPRDSAPNRSLLEKVAASHALRAVRQRSTVFVTDLFDHTEGKTVSKQFLSSGAALRQSIVHGSNARKERTRSKYILSASERLNPRSARIAGKEPLTRP